MAVTGISQNAQQFIAQYIHSIEQLEIFLVLGENARTAWSAREIFLKIQSSEKSISACLQSFLDAGLVGLEGADKYRFSQTPLLVEIASELARAYRERHVTLIETIYKHPVNQIQSFADAFKLRKDK